jgi:hypothetical protein
MGDQKEVQNCSAKKLEIIQRQISNKPRYADTVYTKMLLFIRL